MKRSFGIVCILIFGFIVPTARSAEQIKRLAVLDFENLSGQKPLHPIGIGIAEALNAELGRVRDFTLVERHRLNDLVKEITLGASQLIRPDTAQRMGKLLGADTVVVGSFQKFQNDIRIGARLIDVDTGVIRAAASVEGPFKEVFKLQRDLAAKLAAEVKAVIRQVPPAVPINNVAALQAFSDGVYFFRNDLLSDALAQFDRALALEPNYVDAQFYRGLALEKLERWDDAIAAFRQALPRSQPERRVVWSWEAPFTADRSKRGIVAGLDTSEVSWQRDVLNSDGMKGLQKRLIYGERSGKNTVLYFVDLEARRVKRVEIPDDKINLNDVVIATDRLTILPSVNVSDLRVPDSVGLWGVGDGDGAIWWHYDLKNLGSQLPMIGAAGDDAYVFFSNGGRLAALDNRTGKVRWTRDGMALDRLEPAKFRPTRANGNVLVARTAKTIQAIRLSDGKDAWIVEPETTRFTHIVTATSIAIFERDRGVRVVDLESGKTRLEIPVPPFMDNLRLALGPTVVAGAMLHENTLYLQSKTLELHAAALDTGMLWHTPLKRQIQSLRVDSGRVYAGMDSGELIILDAASGAITATRKIAPKNLILDYADAEIVIGSGEKSVYGLEPGTGAKRWEYPAAFWPKDVTYFNGVVTSRTSATQLSALDAATGALLWQYTGRRAPGIFLSKDSFFIIEENGVKEYAIEPAPTVYDRPTSTNRQILTELASALLSKGDLSQAATLVAKVAGEIDADYAPMRAVRARLEKARGNKGAAARELATYAGLVGRDSRAGQQAIAELKQAHGLLWYAPLEGEVAGQPIKVGDKLISVGRATAGRNQIVALNATDGTTVWRQAPERFSDIVIDTSTERAWYVSGVAEDPTAVVLYGLATNSGERKELARWNRSAAVSLAAIAYAAEKLFVLTVSPEVAVNRLTVEIDCFTPAGEKLWNRTHETMANAIGMQLPVGVFAPRADYLIYSLGQDLWTVAAADGAVVHRHQENSVIAPRILRNAEPDAGAQTVYFVNGLREIVGYNLPTGAVISRAAVPENTLSFLLGENMLYATNGVSVFGSGAGSSSARWSLNANKDQRFLSLLASEDALWALRDDMTLLQIDRSTGKVLSEQSMPWPPSGLYVSGNRAYAFTSDGAAYAILLSEKAR